MSMYYVVVIVMTIMYVTISKKTNKQTQKDSAFMEIIVLEVFKS